MADAYLKSFSQGVKTLLSQDGVNPNATFQTHQRVAKFPGSNLFYTFSLLPIGANNGIVVPREDSHHSDTLNSVDDNGNFHIQTNYVGSAQRFYDEIKLRFAKAHQKGQHLVIIDEGSYINRRLRAGVQP